MTVTRLRTGVLGLAIALTACPGDDSAPPSEGTTGGEATTTGTPTPAVTSMSGTATTQTPDESTSSTTGEPDPTTTSATDSDTDDGSSSGSSSGGEAMADIDMTLVLEQISQSMYTDTETFGETSCPLSEMCIDAAGERRLLHFSTITPNVGTADFVVGSPTEDPENFEFGECHGHWHFSDFAAYRLLDAENNVAATGHKMAFALIDLAQFLDDAGPDQYPMPDGTQGISVGWADIYGAGLDCQWIDITGVPPGDYTLEISINPAHQVPESDYDNNIVLIDVTLTDEDTGTPDAPDEWTCDPGYYAALDGCDCGCGVLDPDCMNPTADACQYCDIEGSCAEGLSCDAIRNNDNSTCD